MDIRCVGSGLGFGVNPGEIRHSHFCFGCSRNSDKVCRGQQSLVELIIECEMNIDLLSSSGVGQFGPGEGLTLNDTLSFA